MKKTEDKFIEDFARRWNEKLTQYTTISSGEMGVELEEEDKVYVGWSNIKRMLKTFLRAYKRLKQ